MVQKVHYLANTVELLEFKVAQESGKKGSVIFLIDKNFKVDGQDNTGKTQGKN